MGLRNSLRFFVYNPNERIVHPAAKELKDPIKIMADDFAEFVNQHEFTADQVREAYYRLIGVSERTDTDPAIATLLAEMRLLEQQRFPVNRFAKIVGTLQGFEATKKGEETSK